MAISLADNLKIQGRKQNVERDSFATKAAMKAYSANYLPNVFHAMCEEDGCIYIYNVNNTEDATTGKWRKFEGVDKEELAEIKKSVSDGKALVAGAITEKGIDTATDATFATLAENITNIIAGGDSDELSGIAWGEFTVASETKTLTLEYNGIDEPLYMMVCCDGFLDMKFTSDNSEYPSETDQITKRSYGIICIHGMPYKDGETGYFGRLTTIYLNGSIDSDAYASSYSRTSFKVTSIDDESITIGTTAHYVFATDCTYKWIVVGKNYTAIRPSAGGDLPEAEEVDF